MNKQFVIAALLATTQAADCKDAYTDLADNELKAANAEKDLADGRVKKAEEVAAAAAKSTLALKDVFTPIEALVTPFTKHLDDAKAAFKAANDAWNAASDGSKDETIELGDTAALGLWKDANVKMQFTAKKADLPALDKMRSDTKKAKDAADLLLATLKSNKLKYDAELKRRTDQQALYKKAAADAVADKGTYDKAAKRSLQWIEAVKLDNTKLDNGTKITDLLKLAEWDQLKQADFDAVAKWTAAKKAAADLDVTYKAKKKDMDDKYKLVTDNKADEKKKYYTDVIYNDGTVCKSDGTLCTAGDTVGKDRTDQIATYTTLTGKIKDYTDAIPAYEAAYDALIKANQTTDEAELDMNVIKDAAAQAAIDTNTDAAKDDKSAGYETASDKAVANAKSDADATDVAIAAKEAEIRRLVNNQTVAGHIYDLAKDKFDNLKAVRDAAEAKKSHCEKQQTLAQTSFDRANAKLKVYNDQYEAGKTMQKDADDDVAEYKKQVVACKGKIAACSAKQAAAVANCKGVKYKIAQDTYKTWDAQKTKNKEAAVKVAAEYAKVSAAPTGGVAGTRCEFPKKAADGTQAARPKCNDELCCGSANKYLRDGTRLTVETCQPIKGTHTYKFFPKLKSGALEAPRTELWRFYCIQGAQKLAATLAAGVGAAYFMA